MDKKRLIVGMSGASGAPLTIELLLQLKRYSKEIETHLIYTAGAQMTLTQETGYSLEMLNKMADAVYRNEELGAAPASGSFKTMGMIIVPCSMKTLSGIHSGFSENLLLRAADVTLKERRKLVLVPRECPLGTIHLRNMYELSQMGAVLLPPVMSYYNHPKTVEDCSRHIAGKILDQFDLEGDAFIRWNGMDRGIKRTLFGKEIKADATLLDDGIFVLLTGGERSHIGAVSMSDGKGTLQHIELPGHKEGELAKKWMKVISERVSGPVTVAVGIHYNNLKKDQIDEVLNTTDEMLSEIGIV